MAVAKFHFKLDSLLTHRQQVEKEKQLKFARIQQEVQALTRQLQETHAKIAAENKSLTTTHLTGKLDMGFIAHEKRYVNNLHLKIVLGMQKLAAMEGTLNAARAELLAAARDKKVIEKLREKQLARWRAEQDRKEAALMDELGTQLALRNAAEEAARDAALTEIESTPQPSEAAE